MKSKQRPRGPSMPGKCAKQVGFACFLTSRRRAGTPLPLVFCPSGRRASCSAISARRCAVRRRLSASSRRSGCAHVSSRTPWTRSVSAVAACCRCGRRVRIGSAVGDLATVTAVADSERRRARAVHHHAIHVGALAGLLTLVALVRQIENSLSQLTHLQNERVQSLQSERGQ